MQTRSTFVAFLLLLISSSPVHADDPGRIALEELWEVGDSDDDDVLFGVISSAAVDAEGNVYVLDRQLTEVSMFSPAGEFLGTIGREGEGPGEYSRIGHVFVAGPGEIGVMQRMPGKIVCVNQDGTPGGTIELPDTFTQAPAYFFNGQRSGEDFILSVRQMQRTDEGVNMRTSLIRVDASGNEIARMSESETTRNMSSFTVDEKTNIAVLWAVDAQGYVYLNDEFDAYSIRVYDPSGNLSHTIQREFEHRKRSGEEIELNTPRMGIRSRGGGPTRFAEGIPSQTDRDVQGIYARPDGKLWVLNSRGAFDRPDGLLATFDVFDAQGAFLHEISLVGEGDVREDGLVIVRDRVLVLRGLRAAERASRGDGEETDEDAKPMSVACYQIVG